MAFPERFFDDNGNLKTRWFVLIIVICMIAMSTLLPPDADWREYVRCL